MSKNVKGMLFTLIGGILWGLSGTCGQFLFEQKGATPQWLVPIRLTVAGLMMLCILLVKEKGRIFEIWKNKRDAVSLLIFAFFGMMLCQYTYFATVEVSNAGTATVLQYLGPSMIMICICASEKRLPTVTETLAVVCALIGTFLLATHGNIGHMVITKETLVWGLAAAVTLVIYTIQPGKLTLKYGTMMVIGWGMFLGGLPLCMVMKPWSIPVHMDMAVLLSLFAIIVLGALCSFNLYLEGVKIIGATKGSLYACVEPVAATMFSVLWLKTPFQAMDVVGFVFIISTIFLLSLNKVKKIEYNREEKL